MKRKIEETVKSLNRNGFTAIYAKDTESAKYKILDLIPNGSTIGIGDSVSVRQVNVLEELSKNNVIISAFSELIALKSTEGEIKQSQRRKIYDLALDCEFFLTGTNVVTKTGKLINMDSTGNRVVGMIFGPRSPIIVVGKNKIVENLEDGLARLRNVIAPQHAKFKERNTPCAKTGKCTDCNSDERICNIRTILDKQPSQTDISVVVVDEDLGLSWDKSWPKERIERIYSNYTELTWMKGTDWRD